MSAGPPAGESDGDPPAGERAEWDPQFPWERAGGWLRATDRGRFVAYSVALFALLVLAFGLPGALQSVLGETRGFAEGPTVALSPTQVALNALFEVVVLSPVVATLAGVVAALRLDGPSLSVGATGGAGAAAGFGVPLVALLVLRALTGAPLDPRNFGGIGVLYPLTVGVGAVLGGAGAAYLTNRLVP
jgi:hypothetical protein